MKVKQTPKHPPRGWDCFDDKGKKIAWFLEMADAVLWLADQEKKQQQDKRIMALQPMAQWKDDN